MFAVLLPLLINPPPQRCQSLCIFEPWKMSKERERKRKHIFCFWGNNYLNKAPKKNAKEENEKITLERKERQNVWVMCKTSRECWQSVGQICRCVYVAKPLPPPPPSPSAPLPGKKFLMSLLNAAKWTVNLPHSSSSSYVSEFFSEHWNFIGDHGRKYCWP